MTRYVRIGHDIVDGEDIEKACQNIAGTSIGSFKPNRELQFIKFKEDIKDLNRDKIERGGFKQATKSTKLDTISGISTKFYMTFPITDGKAQQKCIKCLDLEKVIVLH